MKKANIIVMTVTGLTLIVASLLKAHQVLTEPIISKGFWESWLFFVIQIPLELGLGIWLVSGLFRKAGWLIAVLAFGAFIVVTLHKGLIGAASCGCFGRVHVNPWITLCVVDIPLFLALLIFRPRGEKLLPPPWPSAKHFFGVAMPTCIVLAALVPTLIFNKPPAKTARYEVVDPKTAEQRAYSSKSCNPAGAGPRPEHPALGSQRARRRRAAKHPTNSSDAPNPTMGNAQAYRHRRFSPLRYCRCRALSLRLSAVSGGHSALRPAQPHYGRQRRYDKIRVYRSSPIRR